MQKVFKQSVPTGLTSGNEIALVPGSTAMIFRVVAPGVSGRSAWLGKRIWTKSKATGSWQETQGQTGPIDGKIELAKGTGSSRKVVEAKFRIEWEPIFYVDTDETTRTVRGRRVAGSVKTLYWIMNVRRQITLNGTRYDRVIKSFENKVVLPFKRG